jgi:20S proteasome alpha/beta subunit
MTIVVGLLCEDGVVIGSDSSATFTAGEMGTIEQPVQKTFVIKDKVIISSTGQGGLSQRFLQIMTRLPDGNEFKSADQFGVAALIAKVTLQDFANTHVRHGCMGALVAFIAKNHFHLCEFALADFQPEHKTPKTWFASMGSGQRLVDISGHARDRFI